ncbi:MAG: hypothetical protein N4A41_06075 [Crocinitomicaceae bacterium]|jgi:hypothetical protein|nr:hypothetical protein [Crocinitomicaceae bacterium]
MKKLPIIAATLAFLPFVACNKPEVVPTPTEKAELNTHFIGTINGTQIEWTKNVSGYANYSSLEYYLDTNTNVYYYKYYGGMKSDTDPKMVRVGLGSFIADPTVQAAPSIEKFKSFIQSYADPNTAPEFKNNAFFGFEVQYRDAAGDLFKSDTTVPGSYVMKDLKYSEDVNGDYMSYTCEFEATVFHKRRDTVNNIDTINKMAVIQNAVLKGWFRRE